jgi:hypothetical protein
MPFTVYQSTFYLNTRFQNIRVPRENLLNLVADVLPNGQYVSVIDDPDQVRFTQYVDMIDVLLIFSEEVTMLICRGLQLSFLRSHLVE